MAKLIPLDEAATMLGVTPEKLTEMRSRGDIFGYRDGATWKFKPQEIDRVAGQMGIEVEESMGSAVNLPLGNEDRERISAIDADLDQLIDLDDVESDDTDGPDSVLVSEHELGQSDPGASSTIIGRNKLGTPDDDLELSLEDDDSREELVLDIDDIGDVAGASGLHLGDHEAGSAHEESSLSLDEGSELRLEGTGEGDAGEDSLLSLADGSQLDLAGSSSDLVLGDEEPTDDSPTAGSTPQLAAGGSESELDLDVGDSGSELDLSSDSSELVLEGASDLSLDSVKSDPVLADSGSVSDVGLADSGSQLSLDASDISLASSDIDLDLGSSTDIKLSGVDSDVTLHAGDSGINLASPRDSGISLEATPSELVAGAEVEALELGDADVIDLGDEAVELDDATVMGDDDFLLTPVESGDAMDDDSGSQVIALDTDEIDSEEATLISADFEEGGAVALEEGVEAVAPLGAPVGGIAAAPEAAYSLWNVVGLGMCALMLALSGMMMTDLVRNMWSWNSTYTLNSTLMDAISGMFGG